MVLNILDLTLVCSMRVDDLQYNHDLLLFCASRHCSHNSAFTKAEAIVVFGANKPLEAIRNGARCRECGLLGAQTIIQYRGQTGLVSIQD